MDSMEELVINASSTEDSQASEISSSSGFPWPFSNLLGDSNNNTMPSPTKTSAATPKKSSKRISFGANKNDRTQTQMPISTKQNPNIVPLVDDKFVVDRFQHDVEQAKLMRRAMDKRKQQKEQQQQQQQRDHNELTEENIRLGLKGLDEAVALRRMVGRTRDALEISELSIELLIAYLRSDPNAFNVPGVSRESVGIRIQNALTLAEEMKSELRGNETKVATTNNANQKNNRQQQPKPQSSIFESLSKILDASNPKKNALPSRKNLSTTRTTITTNKSNRIAGVRIPNKPKTCNTKKNTTNIQKQAGVGAPSPFANSQDPLVQTIKSDLYIDPSKLHNTTWKDIAGLKDAKQALQETAILPLIRPDLFSGLRRPRNILLYGPPGTGKTMLVKAVAHESSCVLFVCTASAMTSKWHGEGEKLLRTLFEVARAAAPSIIFVDEMDALLSSRKSDGEHEASRRFKTEFMTNMDGIVKTGGDENGKHLLVIAATNCPWDIDSAVLRRFPRRIYIPLPDSTTRKALLKNLLGKAEDTDLSKEDIKTVVKRLDGFSGSDISSIASEASFGPIRSLGGMDAIQAAKSSDIRPIQRQDFDKAIDQATKSVSKSLLKQYDQWKEDQAAS
mmetsp:Transcript_8594/g.18530  ORF Transcript_8594/g.18530 Transcript_8594/m.18530 type:complete len:620 (+) Transcript_8594:119-1978(+)